MDDKYRNFDLSPPKTSDKSLDSKGMFRWKKQLKRKDLKRKENIRKRRKEAKKLSREFSRKAYDIMAPLLSKCHEYVVYCEGSFHDTWNSHFYYRMNICGRIGWKGIIVYNGPLIRLPCELD